MMRTSLLALGCLLPLGALADEPVRIAPSERPIQPNLAIGADGTVYLAYIGGDGARDVRLVVSKDGGQTFGPSVVAIAVGGKAQGGRQRGPRVGVDDEGRVYVSAVQPIEQGEPRGGDVWLATSADGGATFGPAVKVNDRANALDTPQSQRSAKEGMHWMAVTPQGEVHLAWLDDRLAPEKGQLIAYAKVDRDEVGKNVLAYVNPQKQVCPCCTPGLAVDRKGNPVIAFRNELDGDHPVFLTRSTNKGKSFKAARPVQRGRAGVKG